MAPRHPIAKPVPQMQLFRWVDRFAGREFLHVREVATITRLSDTAIRTLVDLGKLSGQQYEIAGEEKKALRISAESLLRYMLQHSTMDAEELGQALAAWVEAVPADFLTFLQPLIAARLARRTQRPNC